MYFLVLFESTGERAIFNHDIDSLKFSVKDLLAWVCNRFHLVASSGEKGNQHLILLYDNTPLQSQWFIKDLNIRFGSTLKCIVKEEAKPDYRLFLPIRNETYDIFDSTLHPVETTIFQLRLIACNRSGIPLSAFRLVTNSNSELYDDARLSQYDIDQHSTLTIQTWAGWSDFFNYSIKGYTKAVVKLLNSDELVRQYMLQVALYIAAHYGNVDLARVLLQLGARSDRPVGHHPSRQWCSSDYLHPEYQRCPVHEAIICQQVGIILLFGNRDVTALHKPDGYGLKPWRLALRQQIGSKQREIGLFIFTKQFGGTKLSNKTIVPFRHLYLFKQWAERAREQVYLRQGVQFSSLKRKPFMGSGESLLGYKLLIDGFNNNFEDYYSTAAYTKEKTRAACATLDEGERVKLKMTESYMKNFNTVNLAQAKSISSSILLTHRAKGVARQSAHLDGKNSPTGKQLWHRLSNLFRLETLLLRNAGELLDAELITDEPTSIQNRQNNRTIAGATATNTGVTRASSSLSSTSTVVRNNYAPIPIRLFAPQLRIIKEMIGKQDKIGRTKRHLSGIEWIAVQKGQNNTFQTQRGNSAFPKKLVKQKYKPKVNREPVNSALPDIQRTTSAIDKVPLPGERRKVDYRSILRSNDRLHREIMYNWEKSANLTLPSLSVHCLNEASKFSNRSWIRQIDAAVRFATNHSRRTFESVT